MSSLRTPHMKKKYREYLDLHPFNGSCPICNKSAIKTFTYWKITNNDFPYDAIADEHNMIVPLRHAVEADLTKEELAELVILKNTVINSDYDYIIEAAAKGKTIPSHFHLHLIAAKK